MRPIRARYTKTLNSHYFYDGFRRKRSLAATKHYATTSKRASIGFAMSLVALIVLAQGIVRIFRGEAIAFLGSDELRQRVHSGLRLEFVGTLAIIFAILILLAAYFIYRPRKETVDRIIVLDFAAISIIAGGG